MRSQLLNLASKRTILLCALAAVACSDSTAPGKPATIVLSSTGVLSGVVGQPVAPAPTIQIRDSKGHPLSGVAFTVTVNGGGTLTGTPAQTNGTTSLGTWTLGTTAGVQLLQVSANGLTALSVSATARAAAPATVTPANGAVTATGLFATIATLQPSITVVDAFGNPVPGVPVVVQLTGGGSVQNATPMTSNAGTASVGVWTLGPNPGTQTVSMGVNGLTPVVFTENAIGGFTVDVRFIGPTPSVAVSAAFAAAALRVEEVVTAALTPIQLPNINAATYCGEPTLPVLNETVRNLVIFAEIVPIDGVGGILGRSGPCAGRSDTNLPVFGLMQFDAADMAAMVANGLINSVVLHEMQHVLGFGTMWDGQSFPTLLLQGAGTANPVYVGAAARAAYVAAGGTAPVGVPVEGGTLVGTSNSHWRKSVFASELMTGYVDPFSQPFSRISMAALQDLGYTVSFATANTYSVPAPGALRLQALADSVASVGEWLIYPRARIDGAGRVTLIPPIH